VLFEPLADVVGELVDEEADVSLLSHADGTPSALMLIRVRALEAVKPRGFLDFKEQFLPELAASRTVKVVDSPSRTAAPLRTLGEYIAAMRQFHAARAGNRTWEPFSEQWRPTFRLAEAGASVAESAQIHDSVILDGGQVEQGARVVHSVVTKTGVVAADDLVVDSIVSDGRSVKRKGSR
jgi:NDP-sugar pyrophosphorylase family protein